MKIITTNHFRLYPTKPQEEKLLWTLDQCRFTYNKLLEGLQQQKLNRTELQHSLLRLKEHHPHLSQVYSKTLQYENHRLFSNLRSLSQRKKQGKKAGKLRFKGKNWFNTFTYNQSGFTIITRTPVHDLLHLSKIGDIPMVMHRDIQGTIKQITIKHHLSGKWYASVITEAEQNVPQKPVDKMIGIDLGLVHLATDSDGHSIDHPKHLKKSLDKLKKHQQRLSRKKKASHNRVKARKKVAKIHEHITHQRNDFLHKLSRSYVDTYSLIAVEDLSISYMIRHPYLSQSIADASWSRFTQMLCYKAVRAGSRVVKVDPHGTSQICSQCGGKVKKSLHERIHSCSCGLVMDRDYNAAINILKRAVGQELPQVTPVEIEPLPLQGHVRSMKQDAQAFRPE